MTLAQIITDLRSAIPGPKSNTLSPERIREIVGELEAMQRPTLGALGWNDSRAEWIERRVQEMAEDRSWHCRAVCEVLGYGDDSSAYHLKHSPEKRRVAQDIARLWGDQEAYFEALNAATRAWLADKAADEYDEAKL
jgi:hypothetical protein